MAHCKFCFDPRRNEIDRQYVGGVPLRAIIRTFGGSLGAAHRHRQHVIDLMKARTPSENAEHSSDLLQRVQKLVDEAEVILKDAKATKNLKAATSAIGAATRLLELMGRLTGELQQPNGWIHLNMTRITNNSITVCGDDAELAVLVKEATDSFNPAIIEHFKQLAQ